MPTTLVFDAWMWRPVELATVPVTEGWRPSRERRAGSCTRRGSACAVRAVCRPILRRLDLQKQADLQKQIGVLWQVSERETGIPLDVPVAGSAR